MEVQIASTLNVLSDSIDDKKVQAHGLKFLVECGHSSILLPDLNEIDLDINKIKDLPIIETVMRSIQQNSTVKTILKLGCSVLITYSRYPFCVEDAYRCNVIEYMCSQIIRLASESILSLDLAVVAAYGMAKQDKSAETYKIVLDTIMKIENHWLENEVVLQQIITNFVVIAEFQEFHQELLQSQILQHFQNYFEQYIQNEYIAFGLISTCKGLSNSGILLFLFYQSILEEIIYVPLQSGMQCQICCLDILFQLNLYSSSRKLLLQANCLPLLITITNTCQKEATIIEQAMKVINSVCSAENESIEQVLQSNTVSCIVMCLMSHPMSIPICSHGSRALTWIIKTGGVHVSKLFIDEGVFDLCIDIIQNHNDTELLSSVSSLIIKIIRSSNCDEYCVNHLCETTLFSVLKDKLIEYQKNESIIVSYCNILASLVSNKLCSSMLLDLQLCETLCHLLHCVILDSSISLLTGILWKFSLLMEGRDQLYHCGGVDLIIEEIQLYPTQVTIQRNCLGCLYNLSNQYKEISNLLLSRLALSLLVDSLQDNGYDKQFVLQAIPLLQNVFKNEKCRAFLLQHEIVDLVVKILQQHLDDAITLQIALLFINCISKDKQGIMKLTQTNSVLQTLQNIQTKYDPKTSNVGIIAQGLFGKITKYKEQ